MKAFTYQDYGTPETLILTDVPRPEPDPNEVLVKVAAVSLNPADWIGLRGDVWIARLETGLFAPKKPILGGDIAGWVQAVGADVSGYVPGQKVFGRCRFGGFAEFVCISENQMTHMPESLSFEDAAAAPLAAVTALQGLRRGQIENARRVLINGASGGIGTYMVQLAKHFGAHVTGVCSTRNLELVQSLGADLVIDYSKQPLDQVDQTYDLVIDNVGNLSFASIQRLLSADGQRVVLGFESLGRMLPIILRGAWIARSSNQSIGTMNAEVNTADLTFIKGLLEAGKLHSVIDQCFEFNQLPEAMRSLGTKRARGKFVVTVANPL